MNIKIEILNIYRHAKGLYESAERVARSEGVILCFVCREFHPVGTRHESTEKPPLIVEHKPKKSNPQ